MADATPDEALETLRAVRAASAHLAMVDALEEAREYFDSRAIDGRIVGNEEMRNLRGSHECP